MNFRGRAFIILTISFFVISFTPSTSADETLILEDYIDPDYYFPVDLTTLDDLDYEWTITSDRTIDFIFLTMGEYENCCSEGETDYIDSNDDRNKYSKQRHNFVLKSEESEIILILDNSEIVPGGASPSGPVLIKIYVEEHYEYSFQLLGFLAGSLLLVVIFSGTYVGIGKNNVLLKLEQNQKYIPELRLKITSYLHNNRRKILWEIPSTYVPYVCKYHCFYTRCNHGYGY